MNELTKVLSKSQVIDLFVETKDQIMSGEQNPLKTAVHLKALEEVIKKLRADSQIQDYTLEEAIKEGAKTFKMYGAEIQIKEVNVKYDYSGCNDSLLVGLYAKMAILKVDIQIRENMLKSYFTPISLI